MLFSMLVLGVSVFLLVGPDVVVLGRFAGVLFICAISVIDAYYKARIIWTKMQLTLLN